MIEKFNEQLKDPAFRNDLANNPAKYAKEMGYYREGAQYKVIKGDKNTFYFVLEEDGDLLMDLSEIQAAGDGRVFCFACLGSATSTIATIGSASTA